MARIVKRNVKGKAYFYLEESVKKGGKWEKESIYLGSKVPEKSELRAIFGGFSSRLARKGAKGVTPPFTEFVTRNIASKIEGATAAKERFLGKLAPKQRKEFIARERITFITDSNAIEGSTLDYALTERVVRDRPNIEKYRRKGFIVTGMHREEEEAISLDKCLDCYEKYLLAGKGVSEEMILQLHYILLQKIEGYEKYAGVWRPVNVMVRGSDYKFPDHPQVPSLMRQLVLWCRENEGLIHPVEFAAKFHTKFTTIHPFADGNGRMARLLMNYVLQRNKLPFTNIPLNRRGAYMESQAAGNVGNHKPFTLFLANEILKQNSRLKLEKARSRHK